MRAVARGFAPDLLPWARG